MQWYGTTVAVTFVCLCTVRTELWSYTCKTRLSLHRKANKVCNRLLSSQNVWSKRQKKWKQCSSFILENAAKQFQSWECIFLERLEFVVSYKGKTYERTIVKKQWSYKGLSKSANLTSLTLSWCSFPDNLRWFPLEMKLGSKERILHWARIIEYWVPDLKKIDLILTPHWCTSWLLLISLDFASGTFGFVFVLRCI